MDIVDPVSFELTSPDDPETVVRKLRRKTVAQSRLMAYTFFEMSERHWFEGRFRPGEADLFPLQEKTAYRWRMGLLRLHCKLKIEKLGAGTRLHATCDLLPGDWLPEIVFGFVPFALLLLYQAAGFSVSPQGLQRFERVAFLVMAVTCVKAFVRLVADDLEAPAQQMKARLEQALKAPLPPPQSFGSRTNASRKYKAGSTGGWEFW